MILLYKGRRGSGKTLTMVKDGALYFDEGWKVYRNFDCSYGEYISNDDILALDRNSELFDCVLMLDEVQIFFDSRTSSKKENRTFSNFIQQIRKRGILVLCTTQFSNTIDLRLRQHIDYVAYPNFDSETGICSVQYIDVTSLEPDLIQFSQVQPLYFTLYFYAYPVFRLYDTNYLI